MTTFYEVYNRRLVFWGKATKPATVQEQVAKWQASNRPTSRLVAFTKPTTANPDGFQFYASK